MFETVEDIGIETGTLFKFELIQTHSNPQHTLGRFRLSVTTDDRADFADGLDIGGDVSASWTVLKPESLTSANGTTLEVLSDNSILASGTSPDADTYKVMARTSLTGITGFRLEALEDASLPVSGPGRNGANGNFVLTEFDVSMAALNSLAEETAPPAYSAVDDFDSEINGEANTWSYRLNAGLTRDGNYTPMTTYSANPTRWNPSIPLWTNNTNVPWIGVNTTGGTATWIGNANTFFWPDHTITMHPSFSTLVVVSWHSPEDGIHDVYFSFADMDDNSGDGVDWWVDLGDSAGELASGTFPRGGQSGPRSVLNVSVNAGERINFIVGPGAADEPSFDSTRFEAVILKRPTPVIYGLKSFGTQEFVSSDPVLLFSIDQSGTVLDEIGTVALDATNDEFMRIHASTGKVLSTPVAFTSNSAPFDLHDISDLAFDRHGNAFLSSSGGFYALNTQSGEVTLLFTDAAHLLSGIVFSFASETEQTLFAYDVMNAEDLISFALEDGPPASDLFLNIFPSFNAGRGDLGAEVRCRQLDVVRPDVSFSRVGNQSAIRMGRGTQSFVPNTTHIRSP